MLIREASEQFGWNINYGATALYGVKVVLSVAVS